MPKDLGLLFGAPAIGYLLGNFVSGKFSTQIGSDRMIFLGVSIALVGVSISIIISFVGFGSIFSFFGFMTIVGLSLIHI